MRVDANKPVVSFVVNGAVCKATPPTGLTLLGYLRTTLNLKGAKAGCAMGGCGACTIMLDGTAAQSCQIPLTALEGVEVQTVEAVVCDQPGTSIAAALIDAGAAQCGYCLPGIVVAATAALSRDGATTDLEAALARNLCRCGTHHRILSALRRVQHAMPQGAP